MNKDLFKIHCFVGDYFEDYKGYTFSVGLDPRGCYDVAILFPDGVEINKEYMIPKESCLQSKNEKEMIKQLKRNIEADEHVLVNNNWFTDLIARSFFTIDSDIYAANGNKDRQLLVFYGVGINRDPNCGYILMVKEKDFVAAARKYKKFFKECPNAKASFDKFRKINNTLEDKINANDRDWISRNVPAKEIYFFEKDEIIELCRGFIDEIVKHDEQKLVAIKKHKGVLDTINRIKTEKSNRRKSK